MKMLSFKVLSLLSFCYFGLIASDPIPSSNAIDDEDLADLLNQYYEASPESKRNSLPNIGGYRRSLVPGKRGSGALPNLGIYRRPTISDYMKLAALEMELENEAAAADGAEPAVEGEPTAMEPSSDGHSVDKRLGKKRGSRYGFWVTAINKMDNNHLKGFLGQHRNVYNVYKRAPAKRGTPFVPSMNV